MNSWNEFYDNLSSEVLVNVFHKFPGYYPAKIVIVSDRINSETSNGVHGQIYTDVVNVNYVRNVIEVVSKNRYYETLDMRSCGNIVEYACSFECHKEYITKTPRGMQNRYIVTKNKIGDSHYYVVWNDEMQIRLTQPLDLSCLIAFHLEFNMNLYYLIKNWGVLKNELATEIGEEDAYFYQVNNLRLDDLSLKNGFAQSEAENEVIEDLLNKYCAKLSDVNNLNPEAEPALNEQLQNSLVEDFYVRLNSVVRTKVPVTHMLSHDLIHFIDFF